MDNVRTGRGLLGYIPNDQLVEMERTEEEMRRAEKEQSDVPFTTLLGFLQASKQAAIDAKGDIEDRLLKCQRQRKGEYESDMKQSISDQGGTDIFMKLTDVKCRAAEAWLREVLLPVGERPWGLEPTPKADLPENIESQITIDVVQELAEALQAGENVTQTTILKRLQQLRGEIDKEIKDWGKSEAERLAVKIDDILEEGDFYEAIDEVISDIVTFPTGFVRGPVVRRRTALKWGVDENDRPVPNPTKVLRREYYCPSPHDIFPGPNTSDLQSGDLWERHNLTRADVLSLKGVAGFKDETIDLALREYGETGLKEGVGQEQERADLEDQPERPLHPGGKLEVWEFHGSVQGKMLLEWGMREKDVPAELDEYEVNAWMLGNWIIKVVLNEHPLQHRNYYAASYAKVNGSPWGMSVPELMSDVQRACNAFARALINNAAVGSGPMVGIDIEKLAEGEEVTTIAPWRIWQFASSRFDNSRVPPITFHQPTMNVESLLNAYGYFFQQSSEVTGIPAYIYGSSKVGGAGRTATGLSMLLSAAGKGLKQVVGYIDKGIVIPSIGETYTHVLIHGDREDIFYVDVRVKARASDKLIMAEQLQVRRNEFLNLALHPVVTQLLGAKGINELLRPILKSLKMDVDEILPDEEGLKFISEMLKKEGFNLGAMGSMPRQANLNVGGEPEGGGDATMFGEGQ